MSISLMTMLLGIWRPEYPVALLVVMLLEAILLRALPEKKALLRSTGLFLLFFVLLMLFSNAAGQMQMGSSAAVLNELAVITLGLLVIRLSGLTLFRVIIPAVRLGTPRILEDLVMLLVYISWGLLRLRYAGVNFSGIVATSAVITGIVAFSMQETLGNVLGGVALQLDNSISIGDWIRVDDVSGRVIEVHWRHTAVRTRNGEIVVLPNSLLMKGKFTIVGGTQVPQWRRWVHFAVGLHVPPQRVIAVVERALIDAEIALVSRSPAPQCITMDYKDGCTQYAVRYWLTDAAVDDPTDSVVRLHVYAALQREGYALAHPNMDIQLTNENSAADQMQQEKEQALRRRHLRDIELFSHLSDEELGHLAKTLAYAVFVRGDVMTRQGATAHWLYVLIKGEADVWYEAPGHHGGRRYLATLPAGRVFGEMGMMTGEPRRATVTARTDAECYRIDKANFQGIMQARPELAEQFANILTERNKGLVAVQNEAGQVDHQQQRDRILASIRRFFLL
jgi:small-conductance mechanosensitive channel/CRP-like cAMP-binding protein